MLSEDQDVLSLPEDEGRHRMYVRVGKEITLSLYCLVLRQNKLIFTTDRVSRGSGDDTELMFCLFTPPISQFRGFTHPTPLHPHSFPVNDSFPGAGGFLLGYPTPKDSKLQCWSICHLYIVKSFGIFRKENESPPINQSH